MEDPKQGEINALKLQWKKLVYSHRQQTRLIHMLGDVEDYLSQVDETQEIYQKLKEKKHQLDHLLSQVEEITSEDVEKAQKRLIDRLLEYQPHLLQAYEALHKSSLFLQQREQSYLKQLHGLEELRDQIDAILNARKEVSSFGPIKGIERMRKAAEKLLEESSKDEELNLLLRQLIGLSRMHWDFNLIDKHYSPLRESIIRLHEQYQHTLQVTRKEKLTLEDQLSLWIERL